LIGELNNTLATINGTFSYSIMCARMCVGMLYF